MYDEVFQYVYVFIKVSIIDKPFISNDFSFHSTKKTSRMADLINGLAASYSHRGKPPTTIGAEELNCR
ncbi:hypothetical protein, partial [Peribacillus sp. CSMR9]|uniref:hypothetical protein n=1 Tax=Peribacillus sp. CSMR9 TaxID=2981350 RepID=UPI00295397BA